LAFNSVGEINTSASFLQLEIIYGVFLIDVY
jgi:hypothetical protein